MFGWSPLAWGLIGAAIGCDLFFVVATWRRQRSQRKKGERVSRVARVIFWVCFVVLAGLVIMLLGAVERRRQRAADEARTWREFDRRYVYPAIGRGSR